MIKQVTFFCLTVLINFSITSQSIGKYKYKQKEYFVYPFRIDKSEDVLLVGYKIPDGEYIAFANYNFKEKSKFRRKTKYILTDTTLIKGVFTIKNNVAEGPAIFYDYDVSRNGKQSRKPNQEVKGEFKNGLKHGLWSEGEYGKLPNEYTNYKNGIKHGYRTKCNSSGSVYLKEKFCENDLCDTIFYYWNGKVYKEYDVSETYYSTNNLSCYDRAVELMGMNHNNIYSYYKEIEKDTVIIDIKYKDGKALAFDSIGIKNTHKNGTRNYRYATIKKTDEHRKELTYVNTNNYNNIKEQIYYEDDFVYQSKRTNYRIKYGKKPLFGKRKVKKIDTIIDYNYYLNSNKIIDTSIVPLLVQNSNHNNYKTETYYIPKYKFVFEKDNHSSYFTRYGDKYYTFNHIDTTSKKIYLNACDYGYRNLYKIKSENIFIHEDKEHLNMLKSQPYLTKSFIITNELPNCYERYDRHTESIRNFACDEYDYFPTKITYDKNDTVLNGTYYFSGIKKSKNWPKNIVHTGYTGLFTDIHLGQFINGQKEGPWKVLDYSDLPKRAPQDLKTYFFTHPKNVSSYNEITYLKGMLHGSYVHYQMYNPKEDDSESKEPIVLFKEIESNYTRDTLDGNYKKYHFNGKLMRELNYIMGSPNGEYREYDLSGNLESSIQFDKGCLNGKFITYNNGNMTSFANFKNNALCDSLIYYYPNQLASEKIYAHNDTIIKKIRYFINGKTKEEIFFHKQSTYTIGEEFMLSQSFIETIIAGEYNNLRNVQGAFKNYYDSGQLLSEGEIKDGALYGIWNFYSINGVLIHQVNFQDTTIVLPNNSDTVEISGFYNGFYSNGKKRCVGYIKDMEVSYDCFSKQDKADLDFYTLDFFDINGKQTLNHGNGYYVKYDANGLRVSSGKLINCKEDSLWRYYTPEQKLEMIGNYVDNEKDGVWYEGDLEGINFEDGACFDMNNQEEVKAFNEKRKELSIKKIIYKNGNIIDRQQFESNLNKEYKRKRRRRHYEPTF